MKTTSIFRARDIPQNTYDTPTFSGATLQQRTTGWWVVSYDHTIDQYEAKWFRLQREATLHMGDGALCSLYLNRELHGWLARESEREGISLGRYIVTILRQVYEQREKVDNG